MKISSQALLAIILLSGCSPKVKRQSDFAENLKQIDHIIVIYQENWSFDGLYGKFPNANGFSRDYLPQVNKKGARLKTLPQALDDNDKPDRRFPPLNGTLPLPAAPFDLTTFVAVNQRSGDLWHLFYHEQLQIDDGRMDKFVAWSNNGALALSYIDATNLPEGQLAQHYVLCDNFFHSAFGGSFLNHQFLVAAAPPEWPNAPSNLISDTNPRSPYLDNIVTPDGFAVNTVETINTPHENGKPLLPEQTNPTIGDRLIEKNVSWKWYSGGWDDALNGRPDRNFQFHHQPFAYYANFRDGTKARADHLQDETQFFADLSANQLPAVSFIKPLGPDNEHPGYADLMSGQNHVRQIVDAIEGQKAVWNTSIIIITYDENGGRWDHVSPPKIDKFGPGTRVPTIIVSPYAKSGFIDHAEYETVSILKLIEVRFGLEALSERDSKANPLVNAFDFTKRRS